MATGKNIKICGSRDKKKHDNEKGSSRDSVTNIRCGNAANRQAATFILLAGKKRNPDFSDDFLVRNGAAPGSTIIMTESAFLTKVAWSRLVPLLCKSLRQIVEDAAKTLGIDAHTASKLQALLAFDGFKCHMDPEMLVGFADQLILCLVENRDSSAINQAFDKLVARSGKKRAEHVISMMQRSHVVPVIDQWYLVLVTLAMLRDCAASDVWQNSFIAVNMHPDYRLSIEDWLKKITPAVLGADKFEKENIDLAEMLPKAWIETKEEKKQRWLSIIENGDEAWDVEMIRNLREAGMSLSLLQHGFKLYHAEKAIRAAPEKAMQSKCVTPVKTKADVTPSKMIYHLYNPGDIGLSPMERFEHAISVRNRTLGPQKGTQISPHLNVEVSKDNKRFLMLNDDDLNMHRVLQESMCKHGFRRKVARRTLNALGTASGLCGVLNDETQIDKLKSNLKFAASLEEVRHQEQQRKKLNAEQKAQAKLAVQAARTKRARLKQTKMEGLVRDARKKVGISESELFKSRHLSSLSSTMLSAIAFCCCKVALPGKVAEKRLKLKELLGLQEDDDKGEEGLEEDDDKGESETETEEEYISFDELIIGDIVEVYWSGEKEWYEGEVTGIDDKLVEVHYKSDNQKLWHPPDNYPMCRIE